MIRQLRAAQFEKSKRTQPTDYKTTKHMRSDDDERAGCNDTTSSSSFTHQSVVSERYGSDGSVHHHHHVVVDPATVDPATVDLVLEMTATFDAEGFQQPSCVTRSDVVTALLRAENDVALAVDEIMSVIAIKQLRVDEESSRAEKREQDAQLQWHELCAGLGVSECDAFMKALDNLPEKEKDEMLSTNGGFLQQLLLELDEEEQSTSGSSSSVENEDHPLAKLQAIYPDYRMDTIENVFEQQNFDVNATADALHNLRGINSVQSFAAIVSAQTRAAQQQQDLRTNGPRVESLGHFPGLPPISQQKIDKKLSQKQRNRLLNHGKQSQVEQLQYVQRKPSRLAKLNGTRMNAWERQDIASSGGVMESTLSSELKIDRLKSILPTIDRGVIQTTFFLNACNSDVTEAALREIFNLPVVQQVDEEADENEGGEEPSVEELQSQSYYTETPSYASSRERVDAARNVLSDRYCAVLDSFRRNHHVITTDRVRELSRARRDVRESQREAAHQFFLAHIENLRQGRPIDLHGLIVMEALQVANEAIEFCREQRIRRCLLICGVGHHSINGKARILTAIQLSLNRRQIAYRDNGGMLTIFSLRSLQSVQ